MQAFHLKGKIKEYLLVILQLYAYHEQEKSTLKHSHTVKSGYIISQEYFCSDILCNSKLTSFRIRHSTSIAF